MAIMGVLMLVGMVVNNGIMLIDATNEFLAEGMVVGEALISAGMSRLRPILMTTLTTVLSMLPLLLSGNSGVNMMHGMAVIIVGGLLASTILAMFLMPPFYLLFSGKDMNGMTRKERRAAAKAAKEGSAGNKEDKAPEKKKWGFGRKKKEEAEEIKNGAEDASRDTEKGQDGNDGDNK